MTNLKYVISLTLLILMAFFSHSQAQNVTGFVYEKQASGNKSPLVGVNLYWAGTTTGTFTDNKGKFQISREGITDFRLVISMLGYSKDTIKITKEKARLEIELHPDDQQLGEVEIREKQDNNFISKLNARQTQVINIGELQRAACCNLAESFETNASVDVSYSDAVTGAKQIQLLGLSGIYSQIMTENIPLIRGLASTYGLNYIPGPWMESIQISKGTASVVNGYESTTGQINVEFKKPENSDKFYANIYGNSNLRGEANVNGSVRITDKISTMLLLHADYFGNKFDRNEDTFMDIPKLTTYNIFNRWDYINPGKMVSKFGIRYLDESRNGGMMDFSKSPDFNENTLNSDTTGITAGTKTYGFGVKTKRLEAFWKNGFFLKNHPESSIGLILSGVDHQQDGFYGINQYHGHERSIYANLIYNTSFNKNMHKIATGLSYLLDDYKENYEQTQLTYLYQIYPTPDMNKDTLFKLVDYNIVNFKQDRTEWVPGAFIEYTFNWKEKLTVIAGLRADYDNLWGFFITPRLHIRYRFNENASLRGSVGKGYRTANVLSENQSLFISQRAFTIARDLKQENAWNFGVNYTQEFKLFKNKATFEIDAYRTSFISQVTADMDSLPTAVFFYNLQGKSYANSIQASLTVEPLKRFTILMAFRYNDVKVTEGGHLREKAFVSQYKGLVTLAYATKYDKWKFDLTGQFNGPARVPDSYKMPAFLQRPDYSPFFFQLLGQITKKFKYFDVYLGGENLTNFVQEDRIVEWFRPYHTHFDGAMVWGPTVGITIYAGIRIAIK